jgi:hypothetical protein
LRSEALETGVREKRLARMESLTSDEKGDFRLLCRRALLL